MIFRTQKLEEFKNIQSQSNNKQKLYNLTSNILSSIWPNHHNYFCQTIQSIAQKWMNQFIVIIENWLSQTSLKYINKIQQFLNTNDQNQKLKNYYYLLNLTKYVASMEYPLITSINNISSLYLKFPSDQLIQQPRKTINNPLSSPQSTQLKKKKSLSIQSFTSNIPTKSRSTSKSRKLSFFNNSLKNQQSLFNTFHKQNKYENLNSTVKKVKKDLPFNKTQSITTFSKTQNFQEFKHQNTGFDNNQKQRCRKQQQMKLLKRNIQQRLSNTCSTTFFNQIRLDNSMGRQSYLNLMNMSKHNINNLIVGNNKAQNNMLQSCKYEIQQNLKRQILQEIDKKQKTNYQNMLKDIENKLSSKFDILLSKIIKDKQLQKQNYITKQKQRNYITKQKQRNQQVKNNQFIQKQKSNLIQQNINLQVNKNIKINQQQIGKQPSISNLLKQNKQIQSYLNNEVDQIQEIKPKQVKKQSKVNSSLIVQKDNSKIIKSKNKNYSTFKQNLPVQQTKQIKQIKQVPLKNDNNKKPSNTYKNSIDSTNSIDSIQIIDDKSNLKSFVKKQQPQIIVSKPIQPNSLVSNQQKINKIQDNFYTKRIKLIKSKMENSFKSFKSASQKLALPVNQTFILLFSTSYRQFCSSNTLQIQSPQINQILSKYKTQSQIKNKLPENSQKFILDSLNKIQKMINLKCPPQRKTKIVQYTQKCLQCIQNIFFQKPDLQLNFQAQIMKKIKQIEKSLISQNKQQAK